MKSRNHKLALTLATFTLAILMGPTAQAGAGPQGLTLQGTILTAASLPEESSSVAFTIQIKSPGSEGCLLFQETQTLNMSNSGGAFSMVLGSGVRTGSGFALTSTLPQVFTNAPTVINSLTCASGTTYTPTPGDSRKVTITFDDGSGPQTVSQALNVASVPYAIYSDYLQDKLPTDFVQVNTATAAVSQANLETIFASAANVTKLSNLIAGTSTQYLASGTSTFSGNVVMNGTGTGLAVSSTTASTSSTTGAATIAGGLGVGGAIYTGGAINSGGAINATGAISSSSTVSAATSLTTPIVYGSSAANGNLTLQSTSNVTKGYIAIAPSGGNVGVGVASPGAPLDVNATSLPLASTNGIVAVGSTDTGAVDKGGTISFGGKVDAGATMHSFGIIGGFKENNTSGNEAGYLGFATRVNGSLPAERMRITSAGYVGIGTSAPVVPLQIGAGAGFASSSVKPGGASFVKSLISSTTAGASISQTIGVLDGSRNGRAEFFFTDHATEGSGAWGLWGTYGTNGNQPFVIGSGDVERFRIDNTGLVGIGTALPSYKLDVVNSAIAAVRAQRTDSANTRVPALLVSRSRADATAPDVGFGVSMDFQMEGFTDGSMANAAQIETTWNNTQTNDTTARNSNLVFRTMYQGVLYDALRITPTAAVGINVYPVNGNILDVYGSTSFGSYAGVTAAPTNGIIVSGRVGIGNSSPGKLLHVGSASVATGTAVANFQNVDGTCTITPASSGSGIACSSDERLKENFQDVPGAFALDRLLQLQAVTYNFKTASAESRRTGYKAQQVREVAPEFVRENEDGFLQVYYDAFIPWITESIKTIYHRVQDSEARLRKLEAENAELRARLEKIELAMEKK